MKTDIRSTFLPVPPLPPGLPRLVVTGFMGTGKTTAARRAALALNMPFADLDHIVEKRAGGSIAEIFADVGEARFRILEGQALKDAALISGAVIATGGGAVLHDELGGLAEGSVVAVLTADLSVLEERLVRGGPRPMLGGDLPARVRSLLTARAAGYESAGEKLDTTSLAPEETASLLARRYRGRAPAGAACIPVAAGPQHSYRVTVGRGAILGIAEAFEDLAPPATGIVVVFDDALQASVRTGIIDALEDVAPVSCLSLPGGEACKSLSTVQGLWSHFKSCGLDRSGVVVAAGGGALLDTAGFAAATYMRGVRLVNVPTTLLAMVDAGVGGKVGIDRLGVKNIVGALHHPELVIADPDLLASLSRRALACGMAEVVKVALLASPLVVDLLEEATCGENGIPQHVEWLVEQAVRIKAAYVAADPEDRNLRQSLNLGHTFAHAVEAASRYQVEHGEAVAMGIVAAARLSAQLRGGDGASADRLAELFGRFGLPAAVPHALGRDMLLRAMAADKKWQAGETAFVLPAAGGADLVRGIDPDIALQALAPAGEDARDRSRTAHRPRLRVMVMHGPNLNLLGTREPDLYGSVTLEGIEAVLGRRAQELSIEIGFLQSNIEGELVDAIQNAAGSADALIINPGGYSHTSVAIRDAIAAVGLPAVEVHLTNPAAREEFRRDAVVASACRAVVAGFGWRSYVIALEAVAASEGDQADSVEDAKDAPERSSQGSLRPG